MAAKGKATSTDRREGWLQEAEPISARDRKAVQTLLSALTPISDLRERPISLPFAVVFLSVVLNEPMGRYAKDLNMSRFAMFKYIRSIGDRGRHNAAGLGLVAIKPGPGYPVKTAVVLTDKGRAVAAQVFARLRGTRAHKNTD